MLVSLGFAAGLAIVLTIYPEWLSIFSGPLVVLLVIGLAFAFCCNLALGWSRGERSELPRPSRREFESSIKAPTG